MGEIWARCRRDIGEIGLTLILTLTLSLSLSLSLSLTLASPQYSALRQAGAQCGECGEQRTLRVAVGLGLELGLGLALELG